MKYYPNNSLNKFEFSTIKQWLSENSRTYRGKELSQNLIPYSNFERVKKHLKLTDEGRKLLLLNINIPIDSIKSIAAFSNYLYVEGSTINTEQLMTIRSIIENIKSLHKFLKAHKDDDHFNAPALSSLITSRPFDKDLLKDITQVIDRNGHIKNTASSVLTVIREEQDQVRRDLDRQFRQDLAKYRKLNYLADTEESIRHGRRVLAVRSENKRKVPGVIHDISESGQTTYIEPNNSMQFANELANLEQEERAEIQRILKELTNNIRPKLPLIEDYEEILGRLDFTNAKALLAVSLDARVPVFIDKPIIELKEAYHPILKLQNQKSNKPTLPLNLSLNKNHRIMVISGPNAGGKSVALKTVGLLQLMIQSGIPVPVADGSKMGLFDQILSEIGDEQSIENELSTYSSKLKHMSYFLRHANAKTLFLIDEFGSGTDPNLGGAVAQAILEDLNDKKSYGIVTTHYVNLKAYAEQNDNILNGAMLFDEDSLKPLFQLQTGKPGSSYTFAIAQTSGLPEQTVERAKSISSNDQVELDELLTTTQQSQSELLIQQLALDNQRRELDQQRKELDQLKAQLQDQKTKYQIAKKDEDLRVKTQVKKEFDNYVRQIDRVSNKDKAIQEIRENLTNAARTSESIVKDKMRQLVSKQKTTQNKKIDIGDKVEWIVNHQVGEVLDIKNKKAEVAFGNMRTTIPLKDLVVTSKNQQKKAKTRAAQTATQKPMPKNFQFELDIRGNRYEEAQQKLNDFFDQAILSNTSWVRVLHGKGSGVLKKLTQDVAKQYHSKAIKHPPYEEGGDGISIIEF